MRRTLEDYRPDPAPIAAGPAPDVKPRANFLGAQEDSALTRRTVGGLCATAALLAASFFLFG